jgi:catechol 2,3-dioxygenase-like lactoylglutathione lyase family enzyme
MAIEHSEYFRTPKPRSITVPKLHHATFMTMDVGAMVEFYEAVCGLQPVYYAEHAAWLTNDEANHRIALLRLPGTHPPADKPHSAGLHHTAFEYATFDQWLDNYLRLRRPRHTSGHPPRSRHDHFHVLRGPRRERRRDPGRHVQRLDDVQGMDVGVAGILRRSGRAAVRSREIRRCERPGSPRRKYTPMPVPGNTYRPTPGWN